MVEDSEPLFTHVPTLSREALRALRGTPYRIVQQDPSLIPEFSGVYIWRYWPTFPSLTADGVLSVLRRWREKQPAFEDYAGNRRLGITILRAPLGFAGDGELLGLEESKSRELEQFIGTSDAAREALLVVLETIIASAPPLYIGKADCLRSRLQQHFAGRHQSQVLERIKRAQVPLEDVYISFIADPAPSEARMNLLLEEILQRLTNPPLVKRYA